MNKGKNIFHSCLIKKISLLTVAGLLLVAFETRADKQDQKKSIEYGLFPAAIKIRPHQSVGKKKKIQLYAARNEYESFQIAVAGPVKILDVVPEKITGPVSIPSKHIKIYREDLIKIKKPSNYDGAKGIWPDALIPRKDVFTGEKRNAFPVNIPILENRVIWVDVFIPPDTPAGQYKGKVLIHITKRTAIPIEFELLVWDFTLPSTSSLPNAFGFSGWDVLFGHFDDPDEHYDDIIPLSVKYLDSALMHRITLSSVFHEDWSIYGSLPIDFTRFDRTWRPFIEGRDLPYGLKNSRMTCAEIPEAGETDSQKIDFWINFAAHFKSKGWFDILFDYSFDEPYSAEDYALIINRTALIHRVDPLLRTLITTDIQEARKYGVKDEIDIWVPIINCVHGKPYKKCFSNVYNKNLRESYNHILTQGKELWWYQSCMSHGCAGMPPKDRCESDYPSYMIDHPAVMNRIMSWMTFFYNIHGELYFSTIYAYTEGNPWKNQFFFGGNGDGTLFYPGKPEKIGGKTHIPIASIRLKMIRDGMEDYEYMTILEKNGFRKPAISKMKKLIKNAYSFSHVAGKLNKIRIQLAEIIISLDYSRTEIGANTSCLE